MIRHVNLYTAGQLRECGQHKTQEKMDNDSTVKEIRLRSTMVQKLAATNATSEADNEELSKELWELCQEDPHFGNCHLKENAFHCVGYMGTLRSNMEFCPTVELVLSLICGLVDVSANFHCQVHRSICSYINTHMKVTYTS